MISPTFLLFWLQNQTSHIKKSCLTTVPLNLRVIWSSHLIFYLLLCLECQGTVSPGRATPRHPTFPPSYMTVVPSNVAPPNHKLSGAELRHKKKFWPYIIGISLTTELSCNLAMTVGSHSPQECCVASKKWQILKSSSQTELIHSTSERTCGW